MAGAAAEHRFEEAASLRDQIRALERLDTSQEITRTALRERVHVTSPRPRPRRKCVEVR